MLIKLNALPPEPLPPATETNKSVLDTQLVPETVKSTAPSQAPVSSVTTTEAVKLQYRHEPSSIVAVAS